MKFLKDRQEIARIINIDDTPVITFDLDHEMNGYKGCYEGSKIKIDNGRGRAYSIRCTAHIWSDKEGYDPLLPFMAKQIDLNSRGSCIHSSFGYSDVLEMEQWSNARTVKAGDSVVVLFKSDRQKTCFLRLMKVSDHVTAHCITAATLVDAE